MKNLKSWEQFNESFHSEEDWRNKYWQNNFEDIVDFVKRNQRETKNIIGEDHETLSYTEMAQKLLDTVEDEKEIDDLIFTLSESLDEDDDIDIETMIEEIDAEWSEDAVTCGWYDVIEEVADRISEHKPLTNEDRKEILDSVMDFYNISQEELEEMFDQNYLLDYKDL